MGNSRDNCAVDRYFHAEAYASTESVSRARKEG
jgi:hypothetical protein